MNRAEPGQRQGGTVIAAKRLGLLRREGFDAIESQFAGAFRKGGQ